MPDPIQSVATSGLLTQSPTQIKGEFETLAPGSSSGEAGGSSFSSLLGRTMGSLAESQETAAKAAQSLAAGQSTDATSVVMAVERAQLTMQLASQIRTRAVEAAQDLFRTQV